MKFLVVGTTSFEKNITRSAMDGAVFDLDQINGLAQVCSNSSALTMEWLQSHAKPSAYWVSATQY